MANDDKWKREIDDILEGKTFYGVVPIKKTKINNNLVWIGDNGYTASVGQWIRTVKKKKTEGFTVFRGFKWSTVVDITGDVVQRNWYFGIELGLEHHNKITYVCGGCTDYSGEGGRGRRLAETFLQSTVNENYII